MTVRRVADGRRLLGLAWDNYSGGSGSECVVYALDARECIMKFGQGGILPRVVLSDFFVYANMGYDADDGEYLTVMVVYDLAGTLIRQIDFSAPTDVDVHAVQIPTDEDRVLLLDLTESAQARLGFLELV
jgi:hypothetical protein